MGKKIEGRCRICGTFGKLSEEHIPPRRAFNDNQILFQTIQDALGMSGQRYTKARDGIKRYSLCEKCNNNTGDWYVNKGFVEWTKQGYDWLNKIGEQSQLSLPYHIYPLNVIKQVMVICLAMSEEYRIPYQEELRRFVLNPTNKYLPPDMHIYVYLNKDPKARRFADKEAVISRLDLGTNDYVNAEIALPPFGYCITSRSRRISKSLPEHQGLYEITWFSEFDYDLLRTIYLKLPVKEINSPFPLDYRTKTEVAMDFLKNGVK